MRKKCGFNIVLFVMPAILFLTISCTGTIRKDLSGQLISTDREFSALSGKEGMHRAFLEYMADSVVILKDNSLPLRGKGTLAELYSRNSDSSFILTWEPAFEKISTGGDIGYTWGYYRSRSKQTGEVSSGTYITIWEKQPGGKWKFILDTGTTGLPELK